MNRNYPRAKDLADLPVPILDAEAQQIIVSRHQEAEKLYQQAVKQQQQALELIQHVRFEA